MRKVKANCVVKFDIKSRIAYMDYAGYYEGRINEISRHKNVNIEELQKIIMIPEEERIWREFATSRAACLSC